MTNSHPDLINTDEKGKRYRHLTEVNVLAIKQHEEPIVWMSNNSGKAERDRELLMAKTRRP